MARRPEGYARRSPSREPYDVVLIVCEGAKTEPRYFKGLQVEYGLSNANIVITPADRNDPMGIVLLAEQKMSDDDYDRAFCIFDRE